MESGQVEKWAVCPEPYVDPFCTVADGFLEHGVELKNKKDWGDDTTLFYSGSHFEAFSAFAIYLDSSEHSFMQWCDDVGYLRRDASFSKDTP